MADSAFDDGGGGGTAASLCAMSPQDTIGTIGNLLERIEKLETTVSQMLGANVSAGQLSDLSQQVGWLYGINYMGIPGWAQTEYGTLIPPEGFTLSGSGILMSDGNRYNGVLINPDGSIAFGWGTDPNGNGVLGGTLSGGSVSSYLVCQPATTTLTALQPDISTIKSSRGTAFGTGNLDSGRIDIAEHGYYHLSINFPVLYQHVTPTAYEYMLVTVSNPSLQCKAGRENTGSGSPSFDIANNYIHISFSFECVANGYVQIEFMGVVSLLTGATTNGVVSIEKLASLS